jgi:hypothetical protein
MEFGCARSTDLSSGPDWQVPRHAYRDGGDPYAADLVRGYWPAVRRLVRATFLTPWGQFPRR